MADQIPGASPENVPNADADDQNQMEFSQADADAAFASRFEEAQL